MSRRGSVRPAVFPNSSLFTSSLSLLASPHHPCLHPTSERETDGVSWWGFTLGTVASRWFSQ